MTLAEHQKRIRKQFAKEKLKHYAFIAFMNVFWLAVLVFAVTNNT